MSVRPWGLGSSMLRGISLAMAGKRRRMHREFLICSFALAAAFVPALVNAEENLPAKRSMCQTEARERIRPRGRADGSLYQAVVRKRHEYVQECMTRAPIEPKSPSATGSIRSKAPAQSGGATERRASKSKRSIR